MSYRQLALSRGGYPYAAARGGFLQDLGKGLKRVAGGVLTSLVPGGGLIAGVASAAFQGGGSRPAARPGGVTFGGGGINVGGPRGISLNLPTFGTGTGMGPGGWPTNKDGTPRRKRKDGKPYKRPTMNIGNARAARRSINRIKGVRKMLKSIEAQLPKRSVRGSRGVITRAEANRALRS